MYINFRKYITLSNLVNIFFFAKLQMAWRFINFNFATQQSLLLICNNIVFILQI